MAEPFIAQRAPYLRDEVPGDKWWCACGKSKSQPFCDGSHAGSGFSPMKVTVDAARRVAWCGCKSSARKPYCDGSHSRLK